MQFANRVQYGCQVGIQIPIVDADGDTVRCRWATTAETASIAGLLKTARLDEVQSNFFLKVDFQMVYQIFLSHFFTTMHNL